MFDVFWRPRDQNPTMCPPPSDVNVGLDSPQYLVRYLRTINHSEIGVICTNLAIERGPHIVGT